MRMPSVGVIAVLFAFGGALPMPGETEPVVEIQSGTTLTVNERKTFGEMYFSGGTVFVATNFTDAANNTDGSPLPLEGVNDTRGVVLGGTVTVSGDSVITGRTTVVFGLDGATSTVHVVSGATLTVATPAAGSIRKTGEGTLRFLYPLDAPGTLDLAEGTVRFARDARLSPGVTFTQASQASLVLENGATFEIGRRSAQEAQDLLCDALVWLDATCLTGEDGTSVDSVPNLGRGGGDFRPFEHETVKVPGVPTLQSGAINGKQALRFDGNQALGLTNAVSASQDVTVFLVWHQRDFKKYGGPFSLYPTDLDKPDNNRALHLEIGKAKNELYLLGPNSLKTNLVNTAYGDTFRAALETITVSPTNGVLEEYLSDEHAVVACTNDSLSVSSSGWPFGIVCVGGRMGTGEAAVPQWYGSTDKNNRMSVCDIGEFIVFTHALTSAERKMVTDYLRAKWFGSATAAASGRFGTTESVTLTQEGAGTVTGTLQTLADGSDALTLTGPGTTRLAVKTEPGASMAVSSGKVSFSEEIGSSRAQIWVDAADSDTILLDADGHVTNLLNKGSCGGAFVVAPATSDYTEPVKGPSVGSDQFGNGRRSLYFDKSAALILTNAYRNVTAAITDRSIHVYTVIYRMAKENYSYVWSFGNATSGNDHTTPGTLRMVEYSGKSGKGVNVGMGASKSQELKGTIATEVYAPFLFAVHAGGAGGTFAFECLSNTTTVARSFLFSDLSSNGQAGGFNVDRVLLGGRIVDGCAAYKDSIGSGGANRLWKGYLAEFIVFDNPLSAAEEAELLAYLRQKWGPKPVPHLSVPKFLSAEYGAPDLSGGALKIGAGTTVEHACDALTAASLTVGADVNWIRDWTDCASLFSNVGALSFAGPQTIRFRPALPEDETMLFNGKLTGTNPVWSVPGGNCSVETVADGLWLRRYDGTVLLVR